ncbi:MAG: hypothetical protein UIC45_00625 [Paludibacteraceae bacterium]|jgi:hypothetical protein|nr:hypothetical protein [Paludibacteraceae bacterium]
MNKNIFLLSLILLMSACVSKTKYDIAIKTIDSLTLENSKLIEINDELRNGEERLIKSINKFYADKDFINANLNLEKLKQKHPESLFLVENAKKIDDIIYRSNIQKDSIDKHIQDSIRLANIDELGNWEIGHYVDKFGDYTGDKFIYTRINGYFSNSATSNSKLEVIIKISKYEEDNYYYEFKYDEYADGVEDKYYGGYPAKIKKIENYNTTMIGSCRLGRNGYDYYTYDYVTCHCENKNGSKVDVGFVSLLKNEGVYRFEVTAESNSYSADVEYYFTINSKYLNNALLKAGIDKL